MDLREIGWRSVDWIQLAQERDLWRALVDTVMNLRVLTSRSKFAQDPFYYYISTCALISKAGYFRDISTMFRIPLLNGAVNIFLCCM
jgi:hypothetical protein